MKKLVFIATAFACLSVCMAQEAEPIESFIRTDHDAEWYARQRAAWQQKVDENPQDQWAWRNLFRATNYHEMFTTGCGDEETSPSADIIRRMEKAIPDSYALNLCKGRCCLRSDSAAMRGDNIYRAIELMPEEVCAEDVNYLACRLWSIDPENTKVGELFRKGLEAFVEKYDQVLEVRGKGLLLGLVLKDPDAQKVQDELRTGGLLACVAGPHVVRFLPPLNMSEDDLEEALEMMGEGFEPDPESAETQAALKAFEAKAASEGVIAEYTTINEEDLTQTDYFVYVGEQNEAKAQALADARNDEIAAEGRSEAAEAVVYNFDGEVASEDNEAVELQLIIILLHRLDLIEPVLIRLSYGLERGS